MPKGVIVVFGDLEHRKNELGLVFWDAAALTSTVVPLRVRGRLDVSRAAVCGARRALEKAC